MIKTPKHLSWLIVALLAFTTSTSLLRTEDKAPPFMEVGKTYSTVLGGGLVPVVMEFNVVDLGKDGWIKGKITKVGDEVQDQTDITWINTKVIFIISEVVPEKAVDNTKNKKKKKE